jgi:AmiR/NasT family two-component response regulator
LVERAKGILMRRLSLTEEAAFRRLQRRSQDENRKIRDTAQAIITADEMFQRTAPAPETIDTLPKM